MDIIRRLNTKTALEHLIFLTGQNIIEVCRAFNVTPQQFSDWTKLRRPIPADRLRQLAIYFSVPEDMLADSNRLARRISALTAIELEQLVVANQLKTCATAAEQNELEFRAQQLETERQNQYRIARLATLLDKSDAAILARVDAFLNDMEQQ
jgi:transcriptional regulator with XRE-family HTH domain